MSSAEIALERSWQNRLKSLRSEIEQYELKPVTLHWVPERVLVYDPYDWLGPMIGGTPVLPVDDPERHAN